MARPRRARDVRGVALVAALWLVLLLSVIGLGLALTSGIEAPVARNFEAGWAATRAADAALALSAHDLASVDDWSRALRGSWLPPSLAHADAGSAVPPEWSGATLEQLTALAECGRTVPCSEAERSQATADRPWGRNNPAWTVLGVLPVGPGLALDSSMPFTVVVWAGDDPAEIDGDPRTDGGPDPADPGKPGVGAGRILLRAEAFGPSGSHALAAVTVVRVGAGAVRLDNRAP